MKPHIIILILVSAAFIPEVVYIARLFTKKVSSVNLPRITIMVNGVIFLIGSVLLAVAIIYDVNYLNYKAPMVYSQWKEIVWSDFRAIKRPKQTLHGSQYFAYICSEIDFEFEGDVLKINTLFHPARSYTFSEEVADENLLVHELYHLHITEYWSRSLRKKITSINHKTDKATLKRLIKKYRKKESRMQLLYDDETYHGYILGKQREWQNQIDSCLNNLETFSKPIINLNKN